jgi:endonuclease YncB( thermonuclease family)
MVLVKPHHAIAALVLLATPALAQGFDVTDGDTIKSAWGESFRLDGIDALELAQECERGGRAYPCDLEAKIA